MINYNTFKEDINELYANGVSRRDVRRIYKLYDDFTDTAKEEFSYYLNRDREEYEARVEYIWGFYKNHIDFILYKYEKYRLEF